MNHFHLSFFPFLVCFIHTKYIFLLRWGDVTWSVIKCFMICFMLHQLLYKNIEWMNKKNRNYEYRRYKWHYSNRTKWYAEQKNYTKWKKKKKQQLKWLTLNSNVSANKSKTDHIIITYVLFSTSHVHL